MFTLLAEQQKKNLYRVYRTRLFSLVAFFLSALFLISAALLTPARILLGIEKEALQSEKSTYEASRSGADSKEILGTLAEVKTMASLALPTDIKLYQTIQTVLAKRPASVAITGFSYTREGSKKSTLALSGIAKERSDLISFYKELQKEPSFTSSALPLGSLTKESDVTFTISLSGKF